MAGKSVQESLVSLKSIREILDLMSERGISEFELENNGFRVRVKREGTIAGGGTSPVQPHFAVVHPAPAAGPRLAAGEDLSRSHAQAEAPAAPHAIQGPHEGQHVIKSPIVGTFYASPGPGKPAFIQPGDRVQTGQVLCIIEAMKLMNEIESDTDGEIASIFVEDGQPVEYGQALFALTK